MKDGLRIIGNRVIYGDEFTCPNCRLVWGIDAFSYAEWECRCRWRFEAWWKDEPGLASMLVASEISYREKDPALWDEIEKRLLKVSASVQRVIAEDFGIKFSFNPAKRDYEVWVSPEVET